VFSERFTLLPFEQECFRECPFTDIDGFGAVEDTGKFMRIVCERCQPGSGALCISEIAIKQVFYPLGAVFPGVFVKESTPDVLACKIVDWRCKLSR
jgi:hypothetical protein